MRTSFSRFRHRTGDGGVRAREVQAKMDDLYTLTVSSVSQSTKRQRNSGAQFKIMLIRNYLN